jgi:hypothetical protein
MVISISALVGACGCSTSGLAPFEEARMSLLFLVSPVPKSAKEEPDFIFYLKLFAIVLLCGLERQRKVIALLEAELRKAVGVPGATSLMPTLSEHMR